MSNSPYVSYTKISPHRNSPRNHAIDRISIHCVVGQVTMQSLGEIFQIKAASSNYGVDRDGHVGMYVEEKDRSLMNVPFVTGDEELDALFVKEAKAAGLENLKGHRTVGGMRASIYNAMPIEGVEKLVAFMKDFEEKHTK